MSGSFAYHAPDEPLAWEAPQGIRNRTGPGDVTTDAAIERQPDNMDAQTSDVISNASRLEGARGLPNLKERAT